jgi:hypothetical protein
VCMEISVWVLAVSEVWGNILKPETLTSPVVFGVRVVRDTDR